MLLETSHNDPATGLHQYHTQMVQFIPILKENGFNQISQAGDQGMFFTDGKGLDLSLPAGEQQDGSNAASAFVLAPWAANKDPNIGGMRMDADGNTYFHGEVTATQLNVTAKWWSDFVFDDDYKLMSLGDLEKFIAINNHLPNVPSEKEVLEEGIDVAEMQAFQQQKIEELTLYILELSRELEAMKTIINILKE